MHSRLENVQLYRLKVFSVLFILKFSSYQLHIFDMLLESSTNGNEIHFAQTIPQFPTKMEYPDHQWRYGYQPIGQTHTLH